MDVTKSGSPAPAEAPQQDVLRELDTYRESIREAFSEGHALAVSGASIRDAWERSEARQTEAAFAHTRMSVGAICRTAAPAEAVRPLIARLRRWADYFEQTDEVQCRTLIELLRTSASALEGSVPAPRLIEKETEVQERQSDTRGEGE